MKAQKGFGHCYEWQVNPKNEKRHQRRLSCARGQSRVHTLRRAHRRANVGGLGACVSDSFWLYRCSWAYRSQCPHPCICDLSMKCLCFYSCSSPAKAGYLDFQEMYHIFKSSHHHSFVPSFFSSFRPASFLASRSSPTSSPTLYRKVASFRGFSWPEWTRRTLALARIRQLHEARWSWAMR